MNSVRSKRVLISSVLGMILFLLISPPVFSIQEVGGEAEDQQASMSQAQATMASLFGRGAKMPSVPQAEGTIALPSFDTSRMTIDEGSLPGIQKQKRQDRS